MPGVIPWRPSLRLSCLGEISATATCPEALARKMPAPQQSLGPPAPWTPRLRSVVHVAPTSRVQGQATPRDPLQQQASTAESSASFEPLQQQALSGNVQQCSIVLKKVQAGERNGRQMQHSFDSKQCEIGENTRPRSISSLLSRRALPPRRIAQKRVWRSSVRSYERGFRVVNSKIDAAKAASGEVARDRSIAEAVTHHLPDCDPDVVVDLSNVQTLSLLDYEK